MKTRTLYHSDWQLLQTNVAGVTRLRCRPHDPRSSSSFERGILPPPNSQTRLSLAQNNDVHTIPHYSCWMKTWSALHLSLQILSPRRYHSDSQSLDSIKPLFQGISSSEETQLKPQELQVPLLLLHLFVPPQHFWFMHVHQRSSSADLVLLRFVPQVPLLLYLSRASSFSTCSKVSSTLSSSPSMAEGDPRNWFSWYGTEQHNELRDREVTMRGK